MTVYTKVSSLLHMYGYISGRFRGFEIMDIFGFKISGLLRSKVFFMRGSVLFGRHMWLGLGVGCTGWFGTA